MTRNPARPIDDPGPLVVNLAPTGMVPTRDQSPAVPLQPAEIIRCVIEAANIGITMVHLHARDEHGLPTYRKDVYARIIAGIREQRPDIVIGVSCSGRDFVDIERRSEVLSLQGDLRPDLASLTLSSMNFARQASVNSPETVQALLERMLASRIVPEFEIFDLGMANYAAYLIRKFGLTGPYYANVMLGNIATAQADLLSIGSVAASLPPDTLWGLGGIGDSQIPVTGLAVAVAPAVRIGLEDNLWLDRRRSKLASNQQMVARVHELAALADRSVMSPADLRAFLGLPGWR